MMMQIGFLVASMTSLPVTLAWLCPICSLFLGFLNVS
uniref:Uncharacterized protein n=1 Tax=Rhizophora mucronata TaxID=61149 RepID=A0A2P2NKR9_RHIMU